MATTTSSPVKVPAPKKNSPFKATKRWNQLLSSFKEGMELKRKRWRLKSYESCFSGADAMQWLYAYLQNHPMYGGHVTKQQTYMLLQKFMENKVFQGVATMKNSDKFQDTNYLYRFVDDGDPPEKCNEVITTKEDKENFNSRNSLTNLMRTISKRSSKSDLYQDKNVGLKCQTREDEGNALKSNTLTGIASKPRFTPLSKNMDDMTLLRETNYSKHSTVLFNSDEEDDVFDTSVSQQYLTRCNSLQSYKKSDNQSRQPLGTLWVNEYKKTEAEVETDVKNEKKTEPKKLPRNFGKASLYNLTKNSRLRKRKSDSAPASKSSSKLGKVEEVNEDKGQNAGRQRSYSLNQESPQPLPNRLSWSTMSQAGSQRSISSSLPLKALAILGEHPPMDTLHNSCPDVDINSPIYKRHRLSPLKDASENTFDVDPNESTVDDRRDIGSITNICEKGTWGSNNLELSYCNLLVNNVPENHSDELNDSSSSLKANSTSVAWNSEGLLKKANSISFLGPKSASDFEKPNNSRLRKLPRRPVRKSISQSSLRKSNSGSQKLSTDAREVQGYPFSSCMNSEDKNRLYKVPSCWSIDTIGLIEEEHFQTNQPEITVDDVEETWKNVLILSLKKLLCLDSIKGLCDIDQIHGANIMKNIGWNPSEISQDAPAWLLSAMNCLIDWPNVSPDTEDSILQDLPNYPGFERDVYRAVKEHYHTTLSKPLIPEHLYPLVEKCSDMLFENKSKGIRIMQHIVLLLPCWNRRQLQLLVHLMSKVSTNHLLEVSSELPTRDLVIHSFLQLIIRKGNTLTIETAAKPMRIVNLIMDSYDTVFKAPPTLRGQVDHKLAVILGKPNSEESSMSESVMSGAPASSANVPQFYCKQISTAAYEKEAKDNYQKAINDLLTTLLTDQSFSEKERKRRLKQFQKAYPEIYNERFAAHNVSSCSSTKNEFSANFRHAMKPSFLREKLL